MYFTSLYVRQITSKFNSKMQDFKRALDVNCNLVLPNGSKYVRDVIQWHENSFSFQKITKNRSAARGFALTPPSVIRLKYSTFFT